MEALQSRKVLNPTSSEKPFTVIQTSQVPSNRSSIFGHELDTSDAAFSRHPIKSMPSVVLISDNNDRNTDLAVGEKRIVLETLNADGQADGHTYVLTLGDSSTMRNMVPINAEKKSADDGESQKFNDVSQAWFTSREDKTTLQSKGHVWKQGTFSKDEIELLEANISKYCVENNVVDPAAVIFDMTKDERKDFYRLIAKGLNRPLFSVYRRVIRMYDNKNHIGKYTDEEMKKLKSLRIQYGNNWQAIGHELGRSASSIKDKCRLMKDNCNTGKWFPCEEERLAKAVYQLSRAIPGDMVTTGISWASVARIVSTRSEKQCRTKWLNYLNWKQVGGADWTRDDDIDLITKVCSFEANDENEIDWIKLADGWGSVRSPQWLRGKWWNLRRPLSGSNDSFKEICSQLFASHVVDTHNKIDREDNADEDECEECANADTDIDDADGGTIVEDLSTRGVPVSTQQSTAMVPVVNIRHLPLPVNRVGRRTLDDPRPVQPTPTTVTFELIRPSSASGTFNVTHSPAASMPIAACTSTSTGHIIIQSLASETSNANNLTMQVNPRSQFVIGANPWATANVNTMSTPNVPATLQLAGKLDDNNDRHNCYTNGSQLTDAIIMDTKCRSQRHLTRDIDPFNHQEAKNENRIFVNYFKATESICDCAASPLDGHIELDQDMDMDMEMASSLISDAIRATPEPEESMENEDLLGEDVLDTT